MKILKGICYVFVTIGVLVIAFCQMVSGVANIEHNAIYSKAIGRRSIFDEIFDEDNKTEE